MNTVKFCLLNIEGENSEEYAIDVFNTLNSTGEPLTGFEVFKSKLMQFNKSSKDKHQVERDLMHIENSIKKQRPNRKDMITQTGKLLLYLAVHRDDYKKNKLSDKKFKDQNAYIKDTVKHENALKILQDIKDLSDFVVKNWLPKTSSERTYFKHLSSKDSIFSLKGFDFLRDINHDRVVPVIYKWSEEYLGEQNFDLKNYQTIIELCVAFSCLWRMAFHGGASKIDTEYLTIAKNLKNNSDVKFAKSVISDRFKKEFPKKEFWLEKVLYSNINKNKTITKFLIALIGLQDILRYNPAEWVIFPISNDKNTLDRLGNIILIPKVQEEDFKKDPAQVLLKLPKNNLFNEIIYTGIKENFNRENIDQRTKHLGQLIYKKLAEDILFY